MIAVGTMQWPAHQSGHSRREHAVTRRASDTMGGCRTHLGRVRGPPGSLGASHGARRPPSRRRRAHRPLPCPGRRRSRRGAGRDRAAAGRERRRQDELAAGVRGAACRSSRARRSCSVTTCESTASAVRPHVGLLGHHTALYDDLTVADNVRFWTRAAKADPRRTPTRPWLGSASPVAWPTCPVGRLSAGQRRRVSFAVLLARRPALWLLDEPHAGLDQAARDEVDGIVRDAAPAGATVVIASHELDRAEALAASHRPRRGRACRLRPR